MIRLPHVFCVAVLIANLSSVARAATPPPATIGVGPIVVDMTRSAVERKIGKGSPCALARSSEEITRLCYTDGVSFLEVEYDGRSLMGLVVSEKRDPRRSVGAAMLSERIARWTWNGEPVFRSALPSVPRGWKRSTTGPKTLGFSLDSYQVTKSYDERLGWSLSISEE